MTLSGYDVERVALLARLGIGTEEIERMREQLSAIMEHFRVLEEVDTSYIDPTGHAIAIDNVMREDKPSASLPVEEILANAPKVREGLFQVNPILDQA